MQGPFATQGITSRTEDGMHILLWDLDTLHEGDAQAALYSIKSKYDLGTIHLLKSSGAGYHGLCFDKFTAEEARAILLDTTHQDPRHTQIGYETGRWLLRTAPKAEKPAPALVRTIRAMREDAGDSTSTSEDKAYRASLPPPKHGISEAHVIWFENQYGVRLRRNLDIKKWLDGHKHVTIEDYSTLKP